MRKGYDGLSGLVVNELGRQPLDGSVYVFFNTMRDKVKLLVWDTDGYVIYSKRLERGVRGTPKNQAKKYLAYGRKNGTISVI